MKSTIGLCGSGLNTPFFCSRATAVLRRVAVSEEPQEAEQAKFAVPFIDVPFIVAVVTRLGRVGAGGTQQFSATTHAEKSIRDHLQQRRGF